MNVLFVDCCISQRGAGSRTKALCDAFLKAFLQTTPDATITTVDVAALHLSPLDVDLVNKRDALLKAKSFDAPELALAKQFVEADLIVVGAPYWDLTFPAQLRIYIEHICATGLTYYYDAQGCHGQCKADNLVFLCSGGDYQQDNNLAVAYWEALCPMFGIDTYANVFAGGLDANPAKTQELLAEYCQRAQGVAFAIGLL